MYATFKFLDGTASCSAEEMDSIKVSCRRIFCIQVVWEQLKLKHFGAHCPWSCLHNFLIYNRSKMTLKDAALFDILFLKKGQPAAQFSSTFWWWFFFLSLPYWGAAPRLFLWRMNLSNSFFIHEHIFYGYDDLHNLFLTRCSNIRFPPKRILYTWHMKHLIFDDQAITWWYKQDQSLGIS